MNTQANAAAILSEYDFRVAIDYSGSMGETDSSTRGLTRWDVMQEDLRQFVRDVYAIDTDGIDLVFFGASIKAFSGVTPETLDGIMMQFSPRGGTPTTEALQEVFRLARSGASANKKDFTIVFTDGVPDNFESLKRVIIEQANSQTADDEHTILFRQVGNNEQATKFLKELDDNLKGAKFDIVDSKNYEEAMKFNSTAELCLAAIND